MTTKMKVARYTRTGMIRWYQRYHSDTDLTMEDICAKVGCHLSTLSRWFRKFEEEGVKGDVGISTEAEAEAEDCPPSKTTPIFSQQTQPGTTEALLDENSYLRWWCQGERKGYVDRLLKEMQKD
jgi:transposase-like protein